MSERKKVQIETERNVKYQHKERKKEIKKTRKKGGVTYNKEWMKN